MKGYTGKILFVNLSNGTMKEHKLSEEVYENYLSGVGLGAYVLYHTIPAYADPLGPDNVLGLVSGLLTGTGSVMTGRWMAVCKSPLTGGWGDANCGGTFSPAIKQCGYDGIFFKGISEKPVYLYVDNKGPQIKDASHVWGKDTVEAEEILEKENWVRKKPCIALIGQAGENCSLISGIVNDRGRIAARSGVGAVMGSKRLKAVVLAGSKAISCEDPQGIRSISKEYSEKVRKQNMPGIIGGSVLPMMGKVVMGGKNVSAVDGIMSAMMMKRWGTPVNNTMGVVSGDSPLKNWAGSVEDYDKSYYKNLNPDNIINREFQKYHCYSCVVGCGGICNIDDIGDGKMKHTHKPEYETCCAFGGLLMNKDLNMIFYINEILNRAGMDSISAGATAAFAIECYENGILAKTDTDGLELTWGNSEAIIKLIEKMIAREGLGNILADGVKVASAKIGKGSQRYAVHAGGQEPGMHDSRFDPMLGVHYSVEPTPGRHTIGSSQAYNIYQLWQKVTWAPKVIKYPKDEEYVPSDEEALKAVANSCYKQLYDGSGGCYFAAAMGVQHWKLFEMLNAVTGWNKSPDEYMEIGKRMQSLRQSFNIKHGVDPKSYKMADRMAGIPPLKAGPLKGRTVLIDDMMRLYWKNMGWDEATGVPLTNPEDGKVSLYEGGF
ncbi:aldehyde:ferredoxin oxidoreductase [Anaerosolibacter carboniphilus]|uniref:Aldehyde:ferredoxin oxidoreductase n=1 Tax=Anaerosolibacter carboniphilus TaxID=1417629 RepID=A0A841KQ29_9FIRM|nr:aldehyde ferredoxin oxidoreductase family protein [Anaerosolibacter carboniphilus]MBB6215864.1 aldehyde:ferredoxin oxidoreductase [Anaerosolibacter carboniphilus]